MKNKTMKILMTVGVLIGMLGMMTVCAFGVENEIAKSGAEWLLDGLFWVCVIVAIVVFVKNLAQKNFTGMIITIIVAAIIMFLIKNPTIMESLGQKLAGILGLG